MLGLSSRGLWTGSSMDGWLGYDMLIMSSILLDKENGAWVQHNIKKKSSRIRPIL